MELIGYLGSMIAALYLLIHLIQPVFVKKKSKPGVSDMLVWMTSMTLLLIYSVGIRNYPFIIFFAVVIAWGTLGFFDFFRN